MILYIQTDPLYYIKIKHQNDIRFCNLYNSTMNMFNYLRGQMSKLDVDSPTKSTKRLSPSQQIYLEQITNHIEVEGGYEVLKQKLFRDINEHYMLDSPFIQQLVLLLRKSLQSKMIDSMDIERRTIAIIEDLISHCGPIMNEAFNDRQFCQALQGCILFMNKLKNILKANENIVRATGIFMYWHQKFQTQPHYVYHQFYQNLKKQDIPFPTTPLIKEIKIRKISQQEKQQIQNIQQIINDCEQTAKNAEYILKNDINKIDTAYVRLLKAKVKKIYTISTTPDTQFSPFQKQKLSQVYKKIRSQLKQIQKISQNKAKQKALQKQKQYLEQKITGSPKKVQKQIPKIAIIQHSPIKIYKTQQDDPKFETELSNKKKSSKQQIVIFDRDLLDIEIIKKQPESPKNVQKPTVDLGIIDQKMVTPIKKKQIKEQSQKLLDLDEQYSTPNSSKQLNFKQLYAQSQLSPQLKDLDLVGNSSKKSKQSIKSDDEEEAQFGQYK